MGSELLAGGGIGAAIVAIAGAVQWFFRWRASNRAPQPKPATIADEYSDTDRNIRVDIANVKRHVDEGNAEARRYHVEVAKHFAVSTAHQERTSEILDRLSVDVAVIKDRGK